MAERRMISKVISISEKVNSLSLFGRLLYTWMIPHADDFGRLPGSPMKVRALVVPMADETVKDVESALVDMHKGGLILWYEVEGEKYIQIINFDSHQQGLHKRTKSKFPEPPTEEQGIPEVHQDIPGSSGNFPLELNRTEGNRTEEAAPTRETPSHTIVYECETIHEAHTKAFNTTLIQSMIADFYSKLLTSGHDEKFVMELILEAGESSARPSLRLLQSIYERWKADGVNNREEAKRTNSRDKPYRTPHVVPASRSVSDAEETRRQIAEREALQRKVAEERRRRQLATADP